MKYDPVKIWNDERYLNHASIKCRYDMMKTNKYSEANNIEIGTHWCKNTPYPIIDNDLLEYKTKLEDKTISQLNEKNKSLFETIAQSNLVSYLNSIDHTDEMTKAIRNIKSKSNSTLKTKSIISPNKSTPICIPSSQRINFKSAAQTIVANNKTSSNNNNITNSQKSSTVNTSRKKCSKIIYDIKPITASNEKGKCNFNTSIENDNNNITKQKHMRFQTETDEYKYNNNNYIDNEVICDYTYDDNETRYIDQLTPTGPNDEDKRNYVDLSKVPRGKGNAIRNLQILMGDYSIKNKPTKYESDLKKQRSVYYKQIRVKYFDEPKTNTSPLNNPIIVYKRDKYKKTGKNLFPDMFYNKNYEYNNNKLNLVTANDNMEIIENKLHRQYNHMKKQVLKTYEDYDPTIHKCDEDGYDEIMKYI